MSGIRGGYRDTGLQVTGVDSSCSNSPRTEGVNKPSTQRGLTAEPFHAEETIQAARLETYRTTAVQTPPSPDSRTNKQPAPAPEPTCYSAQQLALREPPQPPYKRNQR
ncbi:uncharacterized protein BDR25DRAFT_361036 [Lindgomyces ingoldianus]|uniref:Uncharacterized protein n=1 Tax=Lindgomyces ingoldianus TaxID=673940 RepID=A0ACB6QEU3_9PLEO|nr:uncharacterized protein BDR25DRAFT_361036 [Lindgomyces ingoldianus]KAF2465128.1 hypothetical protein BDR25DRAFT_361036 [Lindgomyces ingoldianus]